MFYNIIQQPLASLSPPLSAPSPSSSASSSPDPSAPPSPSDMLPSIPRPADYGITPQYGFLPDVAPLEILPDPYYRRWEAVLSNLQPLLLAGRLRTVIRALPVLSTSRLREPAEWRRAYTVLAFLTHAYVWGLAGREKPEERVPPPISVPFLRVCAHLELPPVATYAGVCLWNWRAVFRPEDDDRHPAHGQENAAPRLELDNLATLTTFTGSFDESWFYLISVAIEARGAPLVQVLVDAMRAVRRDDVEGVTRALQTLAEGLDCLSGILERMYDCCDPHVFYNHIRPFLAGSKNMSEAGLPRGVLFEDGSGTETWRQHGGGSNAQSSLIQFFDVVLGVTHRPTGSKSSSAPSRAPAHSSASTSPEGGENNFIHDMRSYMPGLHRRFLYAVSATANIRPFVLARSDSALSTSLLSEADKALVVAYDAALAMLRGLRDSHVRMVSRYIIIPSRETRRRERSLSPTGPTSPLRGGTSEKATPPQQGMGLKGELGGARGTGGTALVPFLKQARDETGEPAVSDWARKLMRMPASTTAAAAKAAAADQATVTSSSPPSNGLLVGKSNTQSVEMVKVGEQADDGSVKIVGLSSIWKVDESEGGLCHW